MAAVTSSSISTSMAAAAPAASLKSEFSGVKVHGVPSLGLKPSARSFKGPSGENKFRGGKDASGSKAKGKGVYQFSKKYGANVDGYSPIYTPEEWSATGDVYAAGPTGLAIWAVTLGALLLGGALLVYNTSALAQ